MRNTKGIYRYDGYHAFKVAAKLHEELFPKETHIDGGSRKIGAIFRALSKAYTDGVEDALQLSPEQRKIEERKILPAHLRDRDV